jgi:CTP:molybdopterin cytidylyltransferase MocA
VVAIVLAGGAGTRIGGPKALLPVGGRSFVSCVCATLERPGVDRVAVVLGHEASRVAREGGLPASVELVVNDRAAEGMLTSIWTGLDAAERMGAQAALLHPVDHPLVAPGTVDRVLEALRGGAVIAVPSHGGRRGHPGGFAREAWPALRAAAPDRGARAVLADHPEWIVHVDGDPGSVAGIDTPEDYARLIGPRP